MQTSSIIRKAKKLERAGEFHSATDFYKKILQKFPKNIEAKNGLARITRRFGEENIPSNSNISEYNKISPEMRDRLWAMHMRREFDALLEFIEEFFQHNPLDYELLFLAGSSCRHLKDFKKAMEYLKSALSLEPENYGANLEVARLFYDSEMFDLAEKTFEACIELAPHERDTYLEYGKLKEVTKQLHEAKELYLKAQSIDPDYPFVLSHIGEVCFALSEFEEANRYFSEALCNHEHFTDLHLKLIHSNKLIAASELQRASEMVKSATEVAELIRDYGDDNELTGTPRFNLALHYLRVGETSTGWKLYGDRFKRPNFPSPERKFKAAKALSLEEMANKKVLIWREQGVGDELMFYNLLSELVRRSDAKFIVECEARLVSLLTRSFPDIEIREETFSKISLKSPCEDFDVHFPLGDLPSLVNLGNNETFKISSWASPEQSLVSEWKNRLHPRKPKIAFAWSSSIIDERRKQQYASLDFFEGLITETDAEWICVQHTTNNTELSALGKAARGKVTLPDINLKDDFENVAAILANCDLILTPSTAVIATAGAVGTPIASFISGARDFCSLGAPLNQYSTYVSPMIPNCEILHLDYGITNEERDKRLREFWMYKIRRHCSL